MKILVIIPAYNEARMLGKVLKSLMAYFSKDDILVIDDGSRDNSSLIAEKYGVRLIRHKKNYGKGVALKDGIEFALREKYDAVITLDGDGQHSPKEIPKFLLNFKKGYDLVIGSRRDEMRKMPIDRYLSNRISTLILSLISGRKLFDSQCGYRLIATCLLRKIRIKKRRFDAESEILYKLLRKGAKVKHVSIEALYGEGDSKIKRLRDTYNFLRLFLEILFNK